MRPLGRALRTLPVRRGSQQPHRAVDPALLVRLLLPPPAAGALGLARRDGAGARRAADRRVALVEERVVRDVVLAHVVPDPVERPVGHRVQLHDPAVVPVQLHLRDVPPAPPLLPAEPRDPRVERRELALQRLHLADLAAPQTQVDAPVHQVRAVIGHHRRDRLRLRVLELHGDPVALAHPFEQVVGLGGEPSRVEREDAHLGVQPPGHVDQHHPVHAAGRADREPGMEALEGPREEVLGRRVLEPLRGPLDPDLFLLEDGEDGLVQRLDRVAVRHHASPPIATSCELEGPLAHLAPPPGWVGGPQLLLAAERAVEGDRARRRGAHRPASGVANAVSSSSSSPRTNSPKLGASSPRRAR